LHEQKALTGGGQKLSHGQFYRKGRKERKDQSALSIPGLNALWTYDGILAWNQYEAIRN